MLKNRLKVIALIVAFVLSVSIPVVRAENEISEDPEANKHTNTAAETTQTDETETKAEATTGENSNAEASNETKSSDETFKKGDVYLIGDEITVDYVVDGNLFVIANNVTINSQIGGDVFAMAKTITIGEQGYIFSNLFTLAQDINIKGVVYDVYSASENNNIEGYVYRDIRSVCSKLSISGAIGRNAFVTFNDVTFGKEGINENGENVVTSKALISGDFNYTSDEEVEIPEGVVSGNVNFEKPDIDVEEAKTAVIGEIIKDKVMSLVTFIATAGVIWFVLLFLAPEFIKESSELITKKPLPTLGYGVVTPIAISLAAIILLIIGLTAKIAVITIFALITLLIVCKSIFAISVNDIISEKLNAEKTIAKFGVLALTCFVLWLIDLIPFVGGLINFVAAIFGLGVVATQFIKFIDDKSKTKKEEK